MGHLQFRFNTKGHRFEAPFYFDVRVQDVTGNEFYLRMTRREFNIAKRRAEKQSDELNAPGWFQDLMD